jgi:hypothetical protein
MTRLAIAAVVVVVGVVVGGWFRRRRRDTSSSVTPSWLNEHLYDRRGDRRFK